MKRLSIILLVLMLLSFPIAVSQTFVQTNQVTVLWDEIAPTQPDDIIAYEVYRTAYPITVERQADPVTGELDPAHESLGVVTNAEDTITFTVEGDFVIGVRTVRQLSGGLTLYSDINWSDVNGASTPDPFVVRYVIVPSAPEGLRLQ